MKPLALSQAFRLFSFNNPWLLIFFILIFANFSLKLKKIVNQKKYNYFLLYTYFDFFVQKAILFCKKKSINCNPFKILSLTFKEKTKRGVSLEQKIIWSENWYYNNEIIYSTNAKAINDLIYDFYNRSCCFKYKSAIYLEIEKKGWFGYFYNDFSPDSIKSTNFTLNLTALAYRTGPESYVICFFEYLCYIYRDEDLDRINLNLHLFFPNRESLVELITFLRFIKRDDISFYIIPLLYKTFSNSKLKVIHYNSLLKLLYSPLPIIILPLFVILNHKTPFKVFKVLVIACLLPGGNPIALEEQLLLTTSNLIFTGKSQAYSLMLQLPYIDQSRMMNHIHGSRLLDTAAVKNSLTYIPKDGPFHQNLDMLLENYPQ
jgi:hypothetical protein